MRENKFEEAVKGEDYSPKDVSRIETGMVWSLGADDMISSGSDLRQLHSLESFDIPRRMSVK
jgi:hypothetical protein